MFGGIFTILMAKALIITEYKSRIRLSIIIYIILVWNCQKLSSFCVGSMCYYCVCYITIDTSKHYISDKDARIDAAAEAAGSLFIQLTPWLHV